MLFKAGITIKWWHSTNFTPIQHYDWFYPRADKEKQANMLATGTVLGLPVTAATLETAAATIVERAKAREGNYVCAANVHMMVTARRDREFCEVIGSAGLVTSDGMPVVWLLRRQGFHYAERVYGQALMLRLCGEAAQHSLAVYFLGSSEETLDRLRTQLMQYVPELNIVGLESPAMLPERAGVDTLAIERIKSSGAHLVFVGLGCPKQEYWMRAHSPYLDATLLGVGAAFDFVSGCKPQAPEWMRQHGMEWLFRLSSEPRRLWKRYLLTNPLFVYYLLRDRFKGPPAGM